MSRHMSFVECFLLDFNVATYVETLDSLVVEPLGANVSSPTTKVR